MKSKIAKLGVEKCTRFYWKSHDAIGMKNDKKVFLVVDELSIAHRRNFGTTCMTKNAVQLIDVAINLVFVWSIFCESRKKKEEEF